MKDETRAWVRKAEEHLEAASVLLQGDLYPQCVFFCEQAIETLLKSIWVEHASEGVPPRVHDLVSLAEDLGLELSEEQLEFLRKLAEQYMPTRYADIPVEYSRETAENYHERTEELFSWLRQRLS